MRHFTARRATIENICTMRWSIFLPKCNPSLNSAKVLINERQLRQKDLIPIFKTESIVSDILNEKRQLTVRHIQELAGFFNLSPAVFFPRSPNIKAIA